MRGGYERNWDGDAEGTHAAVVVVEREERYPSQLFSRYPPRGSEACLERSASLTPRCHEGAVNRDKVARAHTEL